MGRRVRKLSVDAQDRIAEAASEATETIDAIDLVQAYGMEKEREQRFRGAIELAFKADVGCTISDDQGLFGGRSRGRHRP